MSGRLAGVSAEASPDQGFEAFVVARGHALVRYAFLLLGDRGRAEDVVQEALLKASGRWDHIARVEAPEAYVRRIVTNQAASWWRRRSSGELVFDRLPEVAAPAAALAAVEDRQGLLAALRALPARQRAVLVLRYYEDMADGDIAAVLACPEATVRSHAARGLARLRLLEQEHQVAERSARW